MVSDDDLIGSLPDFMSVSTLMKARASVENGERIVYFEASDESVDQQGEVVLAKALKDSVDHFLKFGVVDLDHKSMPAIAKAYGIEKPEEWAIGHPVDVRFDRDTTFVKTCLYKGNTPLAARANDVWEGLTKLSPPRRYYASVGGAVLGRDVRVDPATKNRVPVVTKVRWNNLAATLTPVHPGLSAASTAPVGAFAKSLGGFVIAKTLTAGYGTDSVSLAGGSALREQSLDRKLQSYWQFRDMLANDLRAGHPQNPGVSDLVEHAKTKFGLSADEAAEYVERFVRDLKQGLNKRSKS